MEQLTSPSGSFNSGKKTVRIAVYCILTIMVIVTATPSYIKEVKPGFISIHVLQADAFLHGKLSVGDADELGDYELSVFEDKKYVCLPPFPSILLSIGPDSVILLTPDTRKLNKCTGHL